MTSREWEAARYKQDLSALPDEGGEEAYERVPVEAFARALLRGMGWKGEEAEGAGGASEGGAPAALGAVGRDGRRVDVGVVEFLPRPAGLGLGASLGPAGAGGGGGGGAAAAAGPPKRTDRRWAAHAGPLAPPASGAAAAAAAAAAAPPPRGTTMVDASGRVRHSRRLGEELRPAAEAHAAAPLRPGARVVVSGGAHAGVAAAVIAEEPRPPASSPSSAPAPACASASLVRIRLFPSDEEVVVRREHLGEAPSSRGGGGGGGGGSAVGAGSDRARSGGEGGGGRDRRDRRSSPPPPPASKRQRNDRPPPPPAPVSQQGAPWLLPGIVVKIVDKRLEGGRFYLKRARVVDVPAPGIATLAVLPPSSGASSSRPAAFAASAPCASLSGVRASSLETAVPRAPGSAVVVVAGPHRGRRGRLLARGRSEGGGGGEDSGEVQLRGDLEVVRLPLDWFAEAAAGGAGGGAREGRGGGGCDDDDDDE